MRARLNGHPTVEISATEGTGLKELKERVLKLVTGGMGRREEAFVLRSARQRDSILRCTKAFERAGTALEASMPLEIVALELREAISALDPSCGGEVSEEVLNRIFSRFCIGK